MDLGLLPSINSLAPIDHLNSALGSTFLSHWILPLESFIERFGGFSEYISDHDRSPSFEIPYFFNVALHSKLIDPDVYLLTKLSTLSVFKYQASILGESWDFRIESFADFKARGKGTVFVAESTSQILGSADVALWFGRLLKNA